MVPIVLLLFAVLLVSGLTDTLNYDQLDNFKNNYYDQGHELKTIFVKLELPSYVPVGAIKLITQNVLKVKYKWISKNKVLFYCPRRFPLSDKSMRPAMKHVAVFNQGGAIVTARYCKGWKLHKFLVLSIIPLAILLSLFSNVEALDIAIWIIFGIPFFLFSIHDIFKEPLNNMERGIKHIIEDVENMIENVQQMTSGDGKRARRL